MLENMTEHHLERSHGPLAGTTVLDLGSRIAAPFCAGLLGEQGARVIKIEQPRHGDYLRSIGPFANEVSMMWAVEGRSRQSATVDLRLPEGQALLRRLAAHADVLCENFRPGTMERWGLGPTDLSQSLVYVRVSAYGQTGPRRDEPGVDMLGVALGGLLGLTGDPDHAPVKSSITLSDHLSGVLAALAATAALVRRSSTRQGAVIDASLYGSILRTVDRHIARADIDGTVPCRVGNLGDGGTLPLLFEAADGKYVAVAGTQEQRDGLVAAHGPDRDLAAVVGERTAGDAETMLVRAGIPASVVRDASDLLDVDGPVRDRLVTVSTQEGGEGLQQPPHPTFLGEGLRPTPAPALGSDNEAIWRGIVGLDEQEFVQLQEQGVI